MGQCVCAKPKSQKKYQFDKEPLDTETMASHHSLAKLSFNVTLSNIVLHKCPYNKISSKFCIGSIQQFQFQLKSPSQKREIKWKSELKTRFQMTQYELRKTYLYIYIFNQSKNIIGKLKINLYIISIGPNHQNFKIDYLNGEIGRVSFDFKISQIIDIKIDSLMVQIDLIKKHPGQKFCFSIKPIMEESQNQLNISIPSYTVMEVFDDYEQKQEKIQSQQQLQLMKSPMTPLVRRSSSLKIKLPQKIIKTGSNLIWKKQKCLQLPSVQLKILASDLHHSYFQVLVWKINDQIQKQDQEQKLQYHAQCFISFQKMLSKQPIQVVQSEKSYEQRIIQVTQRLWRNGKDYGKAEFNLKIKNQKYVKQLPICVRTEKGIQKLAPIFHSQDSKNVKSCQQIQKLILINNQIQNKMTLLSNMEAQIGHTKQSRRLKRQIQQNLQEMLRILQKSTKEKLIIFQYANKKELLKAQETFLQIANRISNYLEQQNQSINHIYWLILIYIIKRGQFTLAFVGFDESQRATIEKADISGILNRKIKVAQKYRQFMSSILKLAVKSLSSQGLQLQRKFAQISCAYAYFRISSFRNQVLKCITKQNEQIQITQWRGIQFSLEQDQDYTAIRQNMNAFALLFDWEHCFHKCLGIEQSNQLSSILQQNSSNNWRARFANRNIAFFEFIKHWVEYIECIVYKAKGIQWKYCPGYNRILKAFLLQMKNRKILQYPDSLIEAALKLIINQRLLNPFVTIILNKANIYEPLTVKKSLLFISDLLSSISNSGKTIPTLFNYSVLYKGLKIIFQSDVSFAISSGLLLLYNHFQLFHLDFQRTISMYLLGKVFFKLFLHWDQNVRLYFYYLLIFRILHEFSFYIVQDFNFQVDRKLKHLYNSEVKSRYQKLMNILQNALNIRIQQEKQMMKIVYDKDLHKKMKKKFQKKRKKHNEGLKNEIQSSSSIDIKYSRRKFNQKSQILTKQTSIELYSLNKLDQNRIQKTQSQRLSSQLLEMIQQNYNTMTKLDVTKSNISQYKQNNRKSSSFHFKNTVQDTTLLKDQNTDKKTIRQNLQQSYPNMKFYGGGGQQCKTQFISAQIKQLKEEQIHYLKVGMLTYRCMKQNHLSNMALKKIQRPKLKMLVSMIDQKQIRPDKIDDW